MENENTNERIYLQLYDYETKEFSGLTTYHGLVRIYNSNTWPSRIFWSVVVLSCLSLFMIHSGYLLLGYHSKPTLFQTNTIIPMNGLSFPEVTVCNLNPLNIAKVKNMNISNSQLAYIQKYFNEITATQHPATKAEDEMFRSFTETYHENTGKSFDVRHFLEDVSKTCKETFVSCSFGREKLENCCEHVTTEMTEAGICFRLSNQNNKYRQWYSGNGFGWELVLNGNNGIEEDIEQADYDPEKGFLIMVHEGMKYPRINSYGVAVSPNSQLHAAIFMKNVSLLDKANWGSCSPGWTKNGSVNFPYTANHCEIGCKLKKVENECGCSPLAYSARLGEANKPFCTPMEIKQCFDKLKGPENRWEDDCDCPSECNMLEFDVTNSYSDLDGRSKGFSGFQVENDISYVSLYYSRVAYERIEQQKQLQTADLLSNIAGSMGLFLGMSTVTLLEIFIYLFKSVWGTVNSTRQQQFVDAVAEEEKERAQSIVIIQNGGNEDEQKIPRFPGADRKMSGNSIHIHLDRRNSRMVRGGDLFSAPRGSVSIPSQLLSPLSKHNRQSISYGQLGRKVSAIGLPLPPTQESVESGSSPVPPKSTIRRCSTSTTPSMLTRKLSFASQQSDPAQPVHLSRKVSTSSIFKSQLI